MVDGLEALLAEVVRLRIVGFIIIGIIVATRKREAEDTAPGVELAAEVEVGAQVIACTVRIDLGIADVQRILVDACVLFLEVRGTAGAVAERGREEELGQRVGTPFEAGIEAVVIAYRVVTYMRISKGSAVAGEESLGAAGAFRVVIGVGITGISPDSQLGAELFAEVGAHVPGGCDAVARRAASPSTHTGEHGRSHVGEAHVVGIVQSAGDGELVVADEAVHHGVGFVTVLAAVAGVGIAEPATLHAGFDGEIQDGFFFSIVETGHLGHVGLLVKYLDLINHLSGEVLASYFGVVGKELFAVHHDLGYFLAIDGNLAL